MPIAQKILDKNAKNLIEERSVLIDYNFFNRIQSIYTYDRNILVQNNIPISEMDCVEIGQFSC